MRPRPPRSPLFPYTTLFRSLDSGSLARTARALVATHVAIVPTLVVRSEEHTSELQSRLHLVCRLLLEKKKESAAVIDELRVISQCRYEPPTRHLACHCSGRR